LVRTPTDIDAIVRIDGTLTSGQSLIGMAATTDAQKTTDEGHENSFFGSC
jgi:hypothetical protein